MGKKSKPPAAPDYAALAEQTNQSNKDAMTDQTWANRVDQYSPYGSETWSNQQVTDPNTGKQVTKWTQNTALDPKLQESLEAQMDVQNARSQQAQGLIGRMNSEFGQQMDWSGLTPWANAPQAGNLNPQSIDTSRQGVPQLQGNLDFSGAQNVDDAATTRARAEDAIYKSATSRLDPQWDQRKASMESDLANKGISQNSEAYTRAMGDFDRSRNDAYQQAQMGAVTGGGAEAQRDYGMDLGLRQQQVGEIGTQGNFANTAAGQAFGFGSQAAGDQRAAQAMQFGQQAQAGAQNFGQQQQAATFQNQQRQQQLTEQMQKRGFSLNEINALLSGQQVQSPTFNGYNQAGNAGGVDYSGAGKDQYGAAMDTFNAKQAQSAQTTGAITGLASSAAMIF